MTAREEEPPNVSRPSGVSPKMWEKFQKLQKRREQITRKSTEKRIKSIQKEVLEKVNQELSHPDDQVILKQHSVTEADEPSPRSQQASRDCGMSSVESTSSKKDGDNNHQEQWSEIKQYFHVNHHLHTADQSRAVVKTHLENQIEAAVARGDVRTAERLSDQIATQQFGKSVTEAIEARNFMKRKKEEDAKQQAKKQKKLNWRFDHKQKWETKGNM